MASHQQSPVEVLGPEDVPDVISVLSDAFASYPVMRFVLGPDGDYAAKLRELVTFFVMARVLRDEVLLGVRQAGGLSASALVSHPGRSPNPPALDPLRERTWEDLGHASRSRYEAFAAATAPFTVLDDHLHLNMVGVRGGSRGRGLGRAVLEAVHELSASHESSKGVTLSTEVETNVGLYEHFGYEVLGTADVGGAFTTWVMFRRDKP